MPLVHDHVQIPRLAHPLPGLEDSIDVCCAVVVVVVVVADLQTVFSWLHILARRNPSRGSPAAPGSGPGTQAPPPVFVAPLSKSGGPDLVFDLEYLG